MRTPDLCRQDPPMDIKLSRQKFKKKHICVISKYPSPNKSLLMTKGNMVILAWRNLADFTLIKWPRLTRSVNETYWYHVPPDIMQWKGYAASVVSLLIMHNLNLVMRKHQTNPNQGTFYKVTDKYSLKKSQGHEKMENCHRLEETRKTWQLNVIWDTRLDPGTGKKYIYIYLEKIYIYIWKRNCTE